VLLLLIPIGAYVLVDPERLDIDEAARRSAPGRFVKLTEGYTHYELGGPDDGQVVVLAAGYSVPYYIWDPTYAALVQAGFRVLRYDYYGRGYSDRPDVAYTHDLHVRQLDELFDAVHISGPIDLVGLSFGASIVTTFADRYPSRVRSLIYVDPAFRTPSPVPTLSNMPAAWNFFTVLFDEAGWASEQLGDFLHPERFPDWPDRYRVQLQYRGFRRARLSEIVSNAAMDQTEELKRVGGHDRRVFVIWGRDDKTVPFDESEQLLKAVPRARLLAVDSAGHLPQWEQPALVNAELIAFLRQAH
jgi:pimeloyl-ACP methyl ester carboxylesterase